MCGFCEVLKRYGYFPIKCSALKRRDGAKNDVKGVKDSVLNYLAVVPKVGMSEHLKFVYSKNRS